MQIMLPLELDGGDFPCQTVEQAYDAFFEADNHIQFLIFGETRL